VDPNIAEREIVDVHSVDAEQARKAEHRAGLLRTDLLLIREDRDSLDLAQSCQN